MPNKLRKKYPDCRAIIDCAVFSTETPQSHINKSLLYSHYKSHMIYKALIGMPLGRNNICVRVMSRKYNWLTDNYI